MSFDRILDTLAAPFQNTFVWVGLIIVGVALIGVFVYMRLNKKDEE